MFWQHWNYRPIWTEPFVVHGMKRPLKLDLLFESVQHDIFILILAIFKDDCDKLFEFRISVLINRWHLTGSVPHWNYHTFVAYFFEFYLHILNIMQSRVPHGKIPGLHRHIADEARDDRFCSWKKLLLCSSMLIIIGNSVFQLAAPVWNKPVLYEIIPMYHFPLKRIWSNVAK